MKKIPVAEIFGPTIQGEGPNTGIKTIFVRVAGCDFKCDWCDSKFAWKTDENTLMVTPDELCSLITRVCIDTKTSNVVLTGGNPCLYDFTDVITGLHELGISVDVETQGSILPMWLKLVDNVVISPKAPSSGQIDVHDNIMDWVLNGGIPNTTIKIPVFNDEDFEFAKTFHHFTGFGIKLYLNVGNEDTLEQGDISNRILDKYRWLIDKTMDSNMQKVYVMPQVHTLVWGNKQGV